MIGRRNALLGGGGAAVAASLGAASQRAARAQAGGQDVVVGATVPLTGPLAGSGQQYHFALQMAQDDIQAAGGIGGRKLAIRFEDVGSSNSTAVNAFVKLVREVEPPFVFLSSYSTQNLATEPEVAKARVPVMYAGGANPVAERGNPWMFRLRPNDTVTTTAIARAAMQRVGAKRPGIIYVQDDFGTGSATLTEKLFRDAGLGVAGKEAYGGRDNDMSAQLLALQQAGADCLIAFTYVRDGALVISARRQLGIDLPMVTSGATTLPSTLDLLDPRDLENLYSTTDAFLDPSVGGKVAEYCTRFQRRFGIRPDPFGSCYYDGAMMLADALRKVGPDREKLRAELTAATYDGVTQRYRADAQGNMAHASAIVRFRAGTKDLDLVETVRTAA